ncbi:pentapeptide repeat-containing protein [Patescibacteria group bacterium]|nr:pentapeptide repeat-containing protein [Patescibacteria group bacterium]
MPTKKLSKAELVALLKNGCVAEFNKDRPKGEINLTRVNLFGVNLTEFNLDDANFTFANLTRVIFGDNLTNIKFIFAELDGSNIFEVDTLSCTGVPVGPKKSILDNSPENWKEISNVY